MSAVFITKEGKELPVITLIDGAQRLTVTAREVWGLLHDKAITVSCIRCYERGGQCTRNYPAGCKGHLHA